MNDASDELSKARAEREAWDQHIAQLEAQQAQAEPVTEGVPQGYGGAPDANRLGPREAMEQLWKETSQGGLRQEEVMGLAVARLAQGALRGDDRYLTKPQRFVQVTAGETAGE